MKKILILLSMSLLVANLSSCSGEEESSENETSSESKEVSLIGTWNALENAEADGPMEPVNEGVTITFGEDMMWTMAYKGDKFAGGEYETQAGQVFCYVDDKKDENAPQQYVWNYSMENGKLILDGYYYKGSDKVNLKIIAEK